MKRKNSQVFLTLPSLPVTLLIWTPNVIDMYSSSVDGMTLLLFMVQFREGPSIRGEGYS